MPRTIISIVSFLFISMYSGSCPVPNNDLIFYESEIYNDYSTRIPFKLVDQLIVVKAELMGKKGDFIIDTGSETLLLNKVHFPSKYNLNKKKKEASGAIAIVDNPLEKRIQEFTLKDFKLKNKSSDIIDLSHIQKLMEMRPSI